MKETWLLDERVTFILLLSVLGIFSIQDIKKKRIDFTQCIAVIIFLVTLTGFRLICKKVDILQLVMGIIPAFTVWIVAVFTHESIGKGDAAVIFIIGVMTDIWFVISVILIAMWVGSLFAITAVVIKKKGKKDTMPFVPFLLIGVVLSYVY